MANQGISHLPCRQWKHDLFGWQGKSPSPPSHLLHALAILLLRHAGLSLTRTNASSVIFSGPQHPSHHITPLICIKASLYHSSPYQIDRHNFQERSATLWLS